MKPIINLLETISKTRVDNNKFKMFILHIGEHIDRDTEISLDKETYLNSWISDIQDDEKISSNLAHEIADWIQKNTSRKTAV
jgi:hypothetical protein